MRPEIRRGMCCALTLLSTLFIGVMPSFGELQVWEQTNLNANQKKMIRGRMGATEFVIGNLDLNPDRTAWGVDVGIDVGFSAANAKIRPGLTYYDAAHGDVLMGWLTSKPLQFGRISKEDQFAVGLNAGLLVMIGWRLPNLSGVFLGIDPLLIMQREGGTSGLPLVRGTFPLAARFDWCMDGKRHIMVTGEAGSSGWLSAELEFYITRTFGFYASISGIAYTGATVPLSGVNPQGNDSKKADGSIITFGWRMGNWK